jgi:hypothetical protein
MLHLLMNEHCSVVMKAEPMSRRCRFGINFRLLSQSRKIFRKTEFVSQRLRLWDGRRCSRFRVAVDADRMLEGDASCVKRNDILETSRIYNDEQNLAFASEFDIVLLSSWHTILSRIN